MNLYKVENTYLVAETLTEALWLYRRKMGDEPLKIEQVQADYVYVDTDCVYKDKEK